MNKTNTYEKQGVKRMFKFINHTFSLFHFLLIGCLLFNPITSFGHTNKELSNLTIKELLSKIEQNNDYSIIFDDASLEYLNKSIEAPTNTLSVDELLKNALKNTDLEYTIVGKQIIIHKQAHKLVSKQDRLKEEKRFIKGTVVDEMGEPLIGVNIRIEGTSRGTITDIDGNYSIQVSAEDVLRFSYLGYTDIIRKVGDSTGLSVVMEQATTSLDEVVVVGFGTQKKINLTGSVGIASSDDLKERPVTRAVQALQGLVPGLDISSGGGSLEDRESIKIRGKGSIGIGSSDAPLVLIDGMEGDLYAINPQDIESISVLKDAAASSIYGSRAPFGVILITTKSGKQGKTVINYNNSLRFNTPTKRPKILDSYTFAKYFNEASLNGGGSAHFSDEHLKRIKDYQEGTFTQSIIPNPNNPNYWGDGYRWGNDNVDWYDAMYKKWSFSQEHNLSISGGKDKLNYYVSANFLDQDGQLKIADDSFNRYTVTSKINIPVTDYLEFTYGFRFIRQKYARPSALTSSFYHDLVRQGWPTLPLYDPNGYYFSAPSPALNMAEGGKDSSENDTFNHQFHFRFEPIQNWITHLEFNHRSYSDNRGWELFETFNHDVDGNPYPSRSRSEINRQNTKNDFTNLNLYSSYDFSLSEAHNFKFMLGFQSEDEKNKYLSATRVGVLDSDLPNLDLTTGLDSNGNPVTPTVSGNTWRWRTVGFFGRLNYNYKERYLLESNIRYDGTSRFRKDNRWKFLPSFSLGWNISREKFWSRIEPIVNSFKLRASYGVLGNQNFTSIYPTYQTISLGATQGSWLQNGMKPNVAYLPGRIVENWQWEKIKTWNIGFDFGLLDNRLTGSFDYFVRKNADMIGPGQEMPAVIGQASPNLNNTDMKTYGFDFIIAWSDGFDNGLDYGVKFMLSDSQSKVTKFPNIEGVHSQEGANRYLQGHKIGNIWGYETIGIAQTDEQMQEHLASLPNGGQDALGSNWGAGDIMYKDLDGDGKIDGGAGTIYNPGDKRVIGNEMPRYQFGLELTSNWKGFDFRAFFQGVMKRDSFQDNDWFWGANNSIWYSAGFKQHLDYFRNDSDHFLGLNTNAYYPRPVFGSSKNNQVQTKYLQDASYIRLKNLQIGYTLPSTLIRKIGLSNLRIYLSGENLWTGTRMAKMFDPETVTLNGGRGYPLSKTISLGLSVTL